MDLLLVLMGFTVGTLVGLTGVGGGALMTPFLILYGIPPSIAVGTDLVYAAASKSFATSINIIRDNIKWALVGALALGSLPASLAAIHLLDFLEEHNYDYERLITIVLGVSLVLTSLIIFTRPCLKRLQLPMRWDYLRLPLITISGVFIGLLTALSSVGAGALGAAVLTLFYPTLPMVTVVGTNIAYAFLLACVSGAGHWHVLDTVNAQLLIPLLLGSLPGLYFGATFGFRIPDMWLQRVVAVVLLSVGIGLVV